MSYGIPTFNLAVNIWHSSGSAPPPLTPPDLVTVGNLRFMWTANAVNRGIPTARVFSSLSLPKGTDIRPEDGLTNLAGSGDFVEVPAGTGRFYLVEVIEDVGKGFPNEYRSAILRQITSPIPVP